VRSELEGAQKVELPTEAAMAKKDGMDSDTVPAPPVELEAAVPNSTDERRSNHDREG
jgi:hypothetical protein